MFRDARVYPATTCFHPRFCLSFASDSKKPKKKTRTPQASGIKHLFFFSRKLEQKNCGRDTINFRDVRPDVGVVVTAHRRSWRSFNGTEDVWTRGRLSEADKPEQPQENPWDIKTHAQTHTGTTHKHKRTCLADSNQIRTASFFLFFFSLHPPF